MRLLFVLFTKPCDIICCVIYVRRCYIFRRKLTRERRDAQHRDEFFMESNDPRKRGYNCFEAAIASDQEALRKLNAKKREYLKSSKRADTSHNHAIDASLEDRYVSSMHSYVLCLRPVQ